MSATTNPYRSAAPSFDAPKPETQTLLSTALALGIASLVVQLAVPCLGSLFGVWFGFVGMQKSTVLLRHLTRDFNTSPTLRYAATTARWSSVAGFWVGVLQLVIGVLSFVWFFVGILITGGSLFAELLELLLALFEMLTGWLTGVGP